MTRPSLTEQLNHRHHGTWDQPLPSDTRTQTHAISSADAALVIPDQIRILRLHSSREEAGIKIDEQLYAINTFSANSPVGSNFLAQADRLIDGLRHAYIAVNHETTNSLESMANPLANNAAANMNHYLPQNPMHFSAHTAEDFLQAGGEDGFYVLKQIMHGIANTSSMRIGELINYLRETSIASDLAAGLYNIEELIGVLVGLQHGHTGKGFNPAMLRIVRGKYELTHSARDLAALFAPGKDEEKGPICPASVSRRHVLGNYFNQLEHDFPDANAIIATQNLVCDVLEMLLQ